ncbi:hypothetical protein R3W88_031450 [Solanum pinnatisectum]|uniref:RNase H type-1 domain-containing protein n=1 Tax=Solanum pinnatisectum TaxID=50273 RepID=A0AAV9LLS1_9SOLN|nr:hypothetical protein R3W88_031450 [Solanum pinnatisectum]
MHAEYEERDCHIGSSSGVEPNGKKPQGNKQRKGKGLQEQETPLSLMMNFIIWNVRGANSATFKPAMLVLLKTKMTEHKSLTEELRGIVVMWKEDALKLENLTITVQGIHITVKVLPSTYSWNFSAIYASLDFNTRTLFWEELCTHSTITDREWPIGRDFNEFLNANEKLGGNYHIFFQCPNSTTSWNDIISKSGTPANTPFTSLIGTEWINQWHNIKNNKFNDQLDWGTLIPFCLWNICVSAIDTISQAIEFQWVIVKSTKRSDSKSTTQVSWRPPNPDTFKLNVDGAVKNASGPCGLGGVIRNHLGVWKMGFIEYTPLKDPIRVELQAL